MLPLYFPITFFLLFHYTEYSQACALIESTMKDYQNFIPIMRIFSIFVYHLSLAFLKHALLFYVSFVHLSLIFLSPAPSNAIFKTPLGLFVKYLYYKCSFGLFAAGICVFISLLQPVRPFSTRFFDILIYCLTRHDLSSSRKLI